MALKPPPISDVLAQVNDLVGNSGLKNEMDKNMRALVQSGLAKLDVVSREEFDAQSAILKRTRDQVTELESQLEQLSRELESKGD